jgi:DNA-directed RNA polymerase subunit RPC12/RpoP
MKCWHCQAEVTWGGDDECEESEDYLMVTNLTCPECNSFYLVYYPEQEDVQ